MAERNDRHNDRQLARRYVWLARGAYALCAGLFAACIILQVFFAGAGVLVAASYWIAHRGFGQAIGWLTFAMLGIGLAARLPWRMHALNVLLALLFMLQYVFLWVLGPAVGVPALRALHPVNALALFWLAVYLGQQGWRLLRGSRVGPRGDQALPAGAAGGNV
jgi:hypothetical protein